MTRANNIAVIMLSILLIGGAFAWAINDPNNPAPSNSELQSFDMKHSIIITSKDNNPQTRERDIRKQVTAKQEQGYQIIYFKDNPFKVVMAEPKITDKKPYLGEIEGGTSPFPWSSSF